MIKSIVVSTTPTPKFKEKGLRFGWRSWKHRFWISWYKSCRTFTTDEWSNDSTIKVESICLCSEWTDLKEKVKGIWLLNVKRLRRIRKSLQNDFICFRNIYFIPIYCCICIYCKPIGFCLILPYWDWPQSEVLQSFFQTFLGLPPDYF